MPADDGLTPLTETEVCSRLGCSPKTLARMERDGDFPRGFPAGRGLGRRWYVRDVEAYLWLRMRLTDRPPPKKRKKSGEKSCLPDKGQVQDKSDPS